MRSPRLLPLLAVLVAGVLPPPAALAYTPLSSSQVVAKANAFRVAHGFPGGLVDHPRLSAGCRAHNRWMQLNGLLQHPETPGTPGYSSAGNEAGNTSVLAQGPTWRLGNPWLNAPIHLADILQPGLRTVGASEHFGRNCFTTHATSFPHAPAPTVDTVFSFPRDGATMPYWQNVYEAPAPPQTFGRNPIRNGVPTGPNLIVFYAGPRDLVSTPELSAATLTAPDGASVPLKTVNASELIYLPRGSAVLIPRRPLRPGVTYTYTATFSSDGNEWIPSFRYSTPPRTFTTTQHRLCGAGERGWYRADQCGRGRLPGVASVRSVEAAAARDADGAGPVRVTIETARAGRVVVSATAGGVELGRSSTVIGGASRGLVLLHLDQARLAARLAADPSATLQITARGANVRSTMLPLAR